MTHKFDLIAVAPHADGDRAVFRREFDGVVEQIADGVAELRFVDLRAESAAAGVSTLKAIPACSARDANASLISRTSATRSTSVRRSSTTCASSRDRSSRSLVSASSRFNWVSARSMNICWRGVVRFAGGEFEVGVDGGQRRVNLMGGVGDEAAQRDDGRFDALRHLVKGMCQHAEFVGRVQARRGSKTRPFAICAVASVSSSSGAVMVRLMNQPTAAASSTATAPAPISAQVMPSMISVP